MNNRIKGVVEAGKLPVFLFDNEIVAKLEVAEEEKTDVKDAVKEELPKTADLVDHGFGVMEDQQGDIWYSENGFIYKNATIPEDRAVKRWLSSKEH